MSNSEVDSALGLEASSRCEMSFCYEAIWYAAESDSPPEAFGGYLGGPTAPWT